MITLKVLGSVDLLAPDGSSISPIVTRPKTLAVLAYLATARPRGLHRRDSVIAVFWPDKNQRRARRSLRQTTHFLRSSLGTPALVSRGKEEIGVDRMHLTTDVEAMEEAIGRRDIEAALSLYRGDFMEGFFLRGAPDFEDWIASEQMRLRRELFAAASEAIRAAREARRIEEALSLAHRVVDLRPGHEPSARELMMLCLDAGDRGGAQRTYDRLVKQLSEGFSVDPDPETRAVADLVTREAVATTPSPPRMSSSPGSGEAEADSPSRRTDGATLVIREARRARRNPRSSRLVAVLAIASLAASALVARFGWSGRDSVEASSQAPLAAELVQISEELDGTPLRASRDAAVLLKEAIRADPEHARAHARLALALSGQVQVGGAPPELADSALHLARRAVEEASNDALAWLSLASAFGAQGRLVEADSAFGQGLARDPAYAPLLFGLGWSALLRGDLSRALRTYAAALESRPDAAPIMAQVGALWLLVGHEEKADAWLRAALDRTPEHPAVLALRIGSLVSFGREAEARELVDRWLRLQPDNAEAFAVGARAALNEGDWQRALELGRMGRRLQPRLRGGIGVTIESALGYALLRLGRDGEAAPLLRAAISSGQAAIERGDERPGVYFDVAAGYAALGDRSSAVRWLQEAQRMGWRHHRLVPMGLAQFEGISEVESFAAWQDEIAAELDRARDALDNETDAHRILERVVLGPD